MLILAGKASRTGANPGITRKLSEIVKIWEQPPVYIFDTPGIMVKFLGKGDFGAEKALKIALSGTSRLVSLDGY
jgi:ribosome biogenesis GTPase A